MAGRHIGGGLLCVTGFGCTFFRKKQIELRMRMSHLGSKLCRIVYWIVRVWAACGWVGLFGYKDRAIPLFKEIVNSRRILYQKSKTMPVTMFYSI